MCLKEVTTWTRSALEGAVRSRLLLHAGEVMLLERLWTYEATTVSLYVSH